uniref:Uncharacterized protein n=1 Tax=viral metagenome TaxID=1070528 RepID=A0A6M3KBF9_9ZZZZ
MALYSNTLQVLRHYLSSAVGDLVSGICGVTGATTTKIYAPFLHQADDYYNDQHYEVYVYAGTNIGVTKRATDWVLTDLLLTVHSAYAAACDATSYIELHHIFTEDELRKAINMAIESIASKYLIDVIDDTTITLVADTYEYALPTSFMYLHQIITEDEVDGDEFFESGIIDPRSWSIIKAYPPTLKLDKRYYSITADKDLRLEGQGAQAIVTADTDVIYLPPAWLVQKAITFLPQNKVQSGGLDNTFKQALEISKKEPIVLPYPHARKIVE